MAPDPWFSTYDSTCQIAQEIAEKIQQQNQYERNGENTIRLTVTIRTLLQNLKEKIALLKDLLLNAVSTHQITQLEGDRRQNLLDELVTRERLLVASFKNEGAEPDLIRSSLMTGGAKRGVANPWLFEEPEETRGLGFDEIRQQQQKIIQEQDAGLDALSSIISRQKQMGKEIGNELDEQNEIIDDLANLVENTDGKLRTETRRVNMVDRKSTSCGISLKTLVIKNRRCETETLPAPLVSFCAPLVGIFCGLNSSQFRFTSQKLLHCGEVAWMFLFLLDLELLGVFQLDLSF
eukprot:XP_022274281.1 syntaxin-8 isoform X2 [Canis lupus familiaris]